MEESHSLFIVSIYHGTEGKGINEKNRFLLHQLDEGFPLESLRIREIASIPFSRMLTVDGTSCKQMRWRDVQRMTRVAGSLKKVWIQASVCVSDVHSLDSLQRDEHPVRYLRVDHWIPSDPSKSLNSLILNWICLFLKPCRVPMDLHIRFENSIIGRRICICKCVMSQSFGGF